MARAGLSFPIYNYFSANFLFTEAKNPAVFFCFHEKFGGVSL
jgi:hypothetical protein